jgi:acetyltransferase-like isoleucine patch superfamily enzyme
VWKMDAIGDARYIMMRLLRNLFSHNWLAILYFNFRMLPFKQAIRLPFDFYYQVRFECLSGTVVLNTKECRRGLVKIGGRGSEMFPRMATIVDLRGTVNFTGITEIGHGALIRVDEGAVVSFGERVRIGANSKIFCSTEIQFGDEIDFSWECQIFDTNFHYIKDRDTGCIESVSDSIKIGSFNWFGNRVSVMKGTLTPDHVIVASNSLCNKDYRNFPAYSVLAGSPATLVRNGKERVFEV